MPMRSKAVMDKPCLGRVRFRNHSLNAFHRRFCSRNNAVALLNLVANGFSHQQFKGGISSRFIIAHIYFGELPIRVH